MDEQKMTEVEHQQKYAEAIKQARQGGADTFQAWFNRSADLNQAIVRGHWDLTVHILTPTVCKYIDKPEEKIALEIGYGGGRILNAACSYFGKVIGIDIHQEQDAVAAFLRSQGKRNFDLITTSGSTIPVEAESIDLVYSFIVLQHLPSFEVFQNYIHQTHRCLKPNGIAQLYFGKYAAKLSWFDFLSHFWRGYKEIPEAPTNHTSLVVRPAKARKLCRAAGFRVVDAGTSYKQVPDGYDHLAGGQNFITLLKNPS